MKFKAKDIAQELNISPSTVSLVLNGKKNVNPETRKRVFELIQKKGFELDNVVKMQTMETKSIVFVFHKLYEEIVSQSPFFMDIVGGIEREASQLGYRLFVKYYRAQTDPIESISSEILMAKPTGVIVLGTDISLKDVLTLKALPFPMLVLNSSFAHEPINSVAINNVEGAYLATKHLIECGHRDIGYLRSSIEINNFRERMIGFKQALRDAGLEYRPEYEFSILPSQEGSYNDMKALLAGNPPLPTAFFGDSDKIVVSAMRALREIGVKVPDDISLVGFDDSSFSTMSEPKLTTVRVHTTYLGAVAVRQIDMMIKNPGEGQNLQVYVSPTLIKRESVLRIERE